MQQLPFLTERETLRKQIILLGSSWVMGRVACLGIDVLKRSCYGRNLKLVNTQKGRVDFLLDRLHSQEKKLNSRDVFQYLSRRDIASLIVQQQIFSLPRKKPKFVLMDSFAELTDQRFQSISNKQTFCCNYSDLDISPEFESLFTCKGLLPLNLIGEYYDVFFKTLIKKYGDTPIIFLHFPSNLESRKKFKVRADKIFDEVKAMSKKHQHVHQIFLDTSVKVEGQGDNFPYHFNEDVYLDMAKQLDLIIGSRFR